MFTKQNTKQKVYKHVMFIKQKIYIQVMFFYKTKQNKMFTDKVCLQNKQMFTKQKFYKHVMFTKQTKNKIKKCTGKLCLQRKKKKFTNTLCLQNKNLLTSYVYKTKQRFTNTLCLQNKTIQNRKFTNKLYL